MGAFSDNAVHNHEACTRSARAVHDALDTLNGKWKLPLIVVLQGGPKRFNEIQRALEGITPKTLSKELKDLELNDFVLRRVDTGIPVTVTYELTPYSKSLETVLEALRIWGQQHRERIRSHVREAAAVSRKSL